VPLIVHHIAVVIGALIYIFTHVCAAYGAIAFICMEFTNWFFVPWIMLSQIDMEGTLPHQVAGVLLVITFLACRIVVCTWQGVAFSIDLGQLSASPAEWACVVLAYLIFLFALVLSWLWLKQVYDGLKAGVQDIWRQYRRSARAVKPAAPDVIPAAGHPASKAAEEVSAPPAFTNL